MAGLVAAAPILPITISLSQPGVGRNFTAGADLAADFRARDSSSAALALSELSQSCQLRRWEGRFESRLSGRRTTSGRLYHNNMKVRAVAM
jgi:hypothetical protein